MDVLSGTLTVSRVSGLIALGNSVVLFTVPLLLAILLIYHYDRTRSAASWSVLARQIHSSAWPSVLRTDSVACQNVHWSITAVAYLNVGLALLGVVSGVITPLGLGEEMRLSTVRDARFVYAPDFSSFGNGTMSRPSMPLSRDCQWNNTQCPGAVVDGVVFPVNMTAEIDLNITATTRIPQNITDMFRSATEGSTVASPWEVQYRYWMPFRSKSFDDNQPYAKGRFKHIDMLISEEKFILAEGIIADTINGGIGYRNHTVPQGLAYGGEWEEDILWIEPSIACAGTNLSLESVLDEPSRDSLQYESLKLIDRGGFEHLPMTSPFDDWPNVTTFGPEDLWERVNRTAWLSNILSSIALNLTDMQQWRYGLNISSGEKFNISRSTSSLGITPELGLSAASLGAGWLTSASRGYFLSNGSLIGGSGDNSSILQPEEDYPDILAIAMFGELNGQCRGYYGEVSDYLYAVCGYLFGAGIRTDGGQPLMEEIGSRWEQPMYTCTGAVKASVKAVTFSINGSSALEDTTVQRIRDKEYNRKEEQPLWAMEDWRYPGNEGATPAPLWGIVDSAFDERPGYNFTRSPHFWLPTTNPLRNDITDPVDMLASASAPYAALHALLGGTEAIGSDIMGSFPKYGGGHSFSLISRWRELSSTAGGSEKILRLVWTDIMASATVGTSLQETSARDSTSTDKQRAVDAYSRRLTYDVRYAIPAILLLMMWACLLLAGFIAGLVSRRPFRRLRTLLNDTSVGRHAAIAVDPASKDLARASTDRWLDAAGHIPLKLGDENHQVDSHPYRSQVEPGARDKGPETPFIRPLMRNDSLEGGSDDRTSHARESGRLEEESSDQS